MSKVRQYAAGATIGLMLVVAGCADRPMSVPSSASLMSSGNGERISFNPTEYGRVYVADQTDSNHILYQAEVRKGEMVEVRPVDDKIYVNGRPVFERPLDNDHQFKIYFEPLPEEKVVRYRTTTEEREVIKP